MLRSWNRLYLGDEFISLSGFFGGDGLQTRADELFVFSLLFRLLWPALYTFGVLVIYSVLIYQKKKHNCLRCREENVKFVDSRDLKWVGLTWVCSPPCVAWKEAISCYCGALDE